MAAPPAKGAPKGGAAKGAAPKKSGPARSRVNLYKIDGEKLSRLSRFCPKCGPGIFMANHSDRHTCGSCGYMEKK